MKLDHEDFNYYGFNIERIKEKVEGDLTYLGTFCIFGNYKPVAVFANASPNLEKGHKPYCFLFERDGRILIGGMDEEQMEEERFQTGVYCKNCDTVIYSVNRHDFRPCKCVERKKGVTIDGGKDYTRFLWDKESNYSFVKIDFKTGNIEVTEDARGRKDKEIEEKLDQDETSSK